MSLFLIDLRFENYHFCKKYEISFTSQSKYMRRAFGNRCHHNHERARFICISELFLERQCLLQVNFSRAAKGQICNLQPKNTSNDVYAVFARLCREMNEIIITNNIINKTRNSSDDVAVFQKLFVSIDMNLIR